MLLQTAPGAAPPPRPAVIIFGGGSGPEANQASIEAHVGALKRAVGASTPHVLFGPGRSAVRSVQVLAAERDEAGELLSHIFDHGGGGVGYRKSELATDGPSSKTALLSAIEAAGDRVPGTIVFGAGHGLPAEGDHPAVITLWGASDELSVAELASALDRQSRKGPLALVLGHCHSGAFVELMYRDRGKKNAVSMPPRCVLAAVPADRQASGCTADVHDPSARSYLAMIAEALAAPARADLDENGRVSLAEAHAFARVHDGTIDVPVSTHEAWLRDAFGEKKPSISSWTVERLLSRAQPEDRAVLTALAPQETASAASVERALAALDQQIETLDREITTLNTEHDRARQRARAWIIERWPELSNPFHAAGRALLAKDAVKIAGEARASAEVKAMLALAHQLDDRAAELDTLDAKAAKLERWVRAAENVVLEAELRRRKNRARIEGLEALRACERLEP